jgi:phage tail-like protein
MRLGRTALVINRIEQWQDDAAGIKVATDGLSLVEGCSKGYAKTVPGALDSGLEKAVWHKVTVDAYLPPGTKVTVHYYASDNGEGAGGEVGKKRLGPVILTSLGDLGGETSSPGPGAGGEGPGRRIPLSFLCDGAEGRYLCLFLQLERAAFDSHPKVISLTAEFPRNTYLSFLPDVYQKDPEGKRFLQGFLSIFEDLMGRVEGEIYLSDLLAEPRAICQDEWHLRWLATWLGISPDPEWTPDEVLAFIEIAPQYYRRRGTKAGLVEVLGVFYRPRPEGLDPLPQTEAQRLCTYGRRYRALPRIVESFEIGGVALGEEEEAAREPYRRLYASQEYSFTVLLPGYIGFDLAARAKLARVLQREKPAHTRVCIAYLWPACVLDGHTYLGANTILMKPHSVLGKWWTPMDSVLAQPPARE